MVNILYANDQPGAYPDSYYAATAEALAPFAPLQGPQTADVCIVGAGFSGLSAALHLRQRGYEVVLLDAHRVGWGASGRNGGQVSSGQRVDQQALVKMVGWDAAKQLWQISLDAKALVAHLISELKIDCDYRAGILHPNHKAAYREETEDHVDFLKAEYGYEAARFLERDEMRALVASDAYYEGWYDPDGYHLHPLRYVLGLARGCAAAGVRIYERSEVIAVDHGHTVCIRTASGEVQAKHCILAGNGYLGKLNRRVANRVIPINNYIIATEPLGLDLAKSLIANGAAVADSKFVINYFRISDDQRLIFGGRESYRYRFPKDIKSYVRRAMLDIYPQLEGTRIDYGWGGTLAITMNRMPYFDWLAPNIVTIGGYSGHGVMMATMGGALAAEAIAGTAERFDVMQAVPTRRFPGGYEARLPLLALGMAFYTLRDRL